MQHCRAEDATYAYILHDIHIAAYGSGGGTSVDAKGRQVML